MEEKEKQLPCWNRRGVAQRRGGRFKDNHFDLTTTRPFGLPLLFQAVLSKLASQRTQRL